MEQKKTGMQWVVAGADETGASEAVKREADALEHGDVEQWDSVKHVTETESHIGVQVNKTHGKNGVMRGERGKLLPGTAPLPGAGRKPRAQEAAMLQAIKDSLSPDDIKMYITKALDLAVSQQSARGIIATLSFAASYGLGKPVSASLPKGEKSALIEALLQDDSDPLAQDADIKKE